MTNKFIFVFISIIFLPIDCGTSQDVLCPSLTLHGIIKCDDQVQGRREENNDFSESQPLCQEDEIQNRTVRQVSSQAAFPYRQAGSEEEPERFITIPPELKNKVTSIELSYVDIDPEVLFQFLDYSKTVQSINFTNVKFTSLVPSRSEFLPLLKTFSLDVLMEDFGSLTEERKFPVTISNEYLRSYLFFDKEVEVRNINSDIGKIVSLKINIDLTIHIFKLLKINHEEGRVVLSQIPFSNEILANLPSDFQLKHLALSTVPVNFSLLTNNQFRNIETLVLDAVTGFQSQNLSQAFQILTRLREFVFIRPKTAMSKIEIFARHLPNSLKHLALTNTKLSLDGAGNSSRPMKLNNRQSRQVQVSPIVFPGHAHVPNKSSNPSRATASYRNDLETLYCESCVENSNFLNWIKQLSNVYPKLNKIVLKFHENVDIPITTSAFEHFRNLEYVIINLSGTISLFNKRNGKWYMKSLKYSHGFNHLDYVFNRKNNFWSSEADYIVGTRLRSYEEIGFRTGHFLFNGGYEARRRITTIPKEMQIRLHVVDIVNTAMSKEVFLNSLESAAELKVLRLINVSFTDYFMSDLHFPNLIEYRFDIQIIPQLNYVGLKRITNISTLFFRFHFLFQEPQPGFDVRVNFLSSKVRKHHISYGTCVLLSWDANEGSLISAIIYTSQWLRNIKENPVRKMSFVYWELDPASVPSTIIELNFNFAIIKDMGMILRKLANLKNLKLINVRANRDGNIKEWDWIQIDMEDLSKHSDTLEYLALEKAHLRNYSPRMKFEKVEFVYLESCTFEMDFVKNFMNIFPNLKRLVILGGDDPRLQIYLDVIILGALRSRTVEWILMSKPVSESSPSRVRKEINVIFDRIGITENDYSKNFILERSSNSEPWSHYSNSSLDEPKLESELLEMKGSTDFGRYSQCHVTTYKQGGWRGFVEDLFGSLQEIPNFG